MQKKSTLFLMLVCLFIISANASATDFGFLTRETLTLKTRGKDVVDILQGLSEKGQFNLSVSSSVSGVVTLSLRDVTVEEAFGIVLKSANLACQTEEDIHYIMTLQEFKERYGESFRKQSDMRVFQLENAQAGAIGQVLTQVASSGAKVVSDNVTNTVVLFDQANKIEELTEIVTALDETASENEIEVVEFPINKKEYYVRLVEKIKAAIPRWYFKSSNTKVKVQFTLSDHGELLDTPEVTTFSTPKYWKELAKKVIVDSAPFTPFPADMPSDKETFEIELAL